MINEWQLLNGLLITSKQARDPVKRHIFPLTLHLLPAALSIILHQFPCLGQAPAAESRPLESEALPYCNHQSARIWAPPIPLQAAPFSKEIERPGKGALSFGAIESGLVLSFQFIPSICLEVPLSFERSVDLVINFLLSPKDQSCIKLRVL